MTVFGTCATRRTDIFSAYAALRKLRLTSLFPGLRGRAPTHAQVRFLCRIPRPGVYGREPLSGPGPRL